MTNYFYNIDFELIIYIHPNFIKLITKKQVDKIKL